MTLRTVVRPELVAEASEARRWYEHQAAGLGLRFQSALFAALDQVEENPELFRKVFSDFRRILLSRFPYFVYYRVEKDLIVFLLLFHCARNPRKARMSLVQRR